MVAGRRQRGALLGWCLYDWANSAFTTVMLTFVFGVYFAKGIIGDQTMGSALWGYALGVSGLLVALLAPVLGAIADGTGARKPWLGWFTALSVTATAALWWAVPDPASQWFALGMVVLAAIAYELGQVFYNAMLPDIAPAERLGRVSGWGWGLGYLGGLTCLGLCLLLIRAEPPLFGLDKATQEPVRATALLVAGWFGLFALPLFVLTPDRAAGAVSMTSGQAVRQGLARLRATWARLPDMPGMLRFLMASALYRDGLGTLFAVGGLYAAGSFGMSFSEILIFGIGLNITAGLGALAFGWLDDRLGSRRTVLLALAGLILFGSAILLVGDRWWFMALALAMGVFVGPAQSASRALLARLSRPEHMTEMFGLYALTGKSVAFLGPLAFGLVTDLTGSQRWGMSVVIGFLLLGAWLLWSMPARPAAAPTAAPDSETAAAG